MTLGLYDYDRRYRRRFWIGFVKIIVYIVVLLAVGLFAYELGVEQFKQRDAALREEVRELSQQKSELELLASQRRQGQLNAEQRVAELETRLEREIPRGELARLMTLVAERIASGVSPARLAFVISQAQEQRDCSAPETKRFMLSTPIFRSPAGAVGFGNGTITVTGVGRSAVDENGNPEAWYDPAEPVNLRITTQNGDETVVEDVLPIHKSVVFDESEYRLNIMSGARSFVEVTADRCPYP